MAESPAGWSPCETWTAAVPSADWRPSIQECEYACADGERLAVECFPRRVGWMVLVADGALRLVAGLDVRQIVVDEAHLAVVSELACPYELRLQPEQ
jgi:hypothetical protein